MPITERVSDTQLGATEVLAAVDYEGYVMVPSVVALAMVAEIRATREVDVPVAPQAWFVYEAARLQAIAVDAPVVPEPWQERDQAFRTQFINVVAVICGPDRKSDPAELYDDWIKAYEAMGWGHGSVHDPRGQDAQDAVFVALCDIARQWINA